MNSTQTEKYFLTSSEDVRPNQITLKAFRLQKKIRWKMKGQADIYLKHRRCLNYKETEKIPAKDFLEWNCTGKIKINFNKAWA